MSVLWLAPFAFAGLALLLIPIVIHLLARQHSRRVPFPSLRFLPASQLAALRRRAIADWPLLLLRLAILAVAVAAAAAPVFVSDARRTAWETRAARAIVVSGEDDEVITAAEGVAQTSAFSARFAHPNIADALRDAALWLDAQPPAAREVVIVGNLRDGSLAATDLDLLAPHVGVRFVAFATPHAESRVVSAVADARSGLRESHVTVTAQPTATHAETRAARDVVGPRVRVVASTAQQDYANTLLRAVLRSGLVIGHDSRQVTMLFDGAAATKMDAPTEEWMRYVLQHNPDVAGGESDGRLIVQAGMTVEDERAPRLLSEVLRTAFDPDFSELEPRAISDDTLARWTRPAGVLPADVMPGDEGDRRWLWGIVLGLLLLEHVARRRRHA